MSTTDRRPAPELAGATEALVHERASATPREHGAREERARGGDQASRVTQLDPPPLPRSTALRALEEWFIEAVTSPCDEDKLKNDAGQVLTRGPALDPAARLGIYRYAYRARLVECLADDYPALQYALGVEAFEALCHEYIQRHPSSSPSLNFYGRHMATYCRTEVSLFPSPARAHFASDLAALEWALVEVLHAPIADALSPARLGAIPVERWALARLPPSPAVRVLRSEYPVNAYFQAFKSDNEPVVPSEKEPSATAVYRTDMTLWRMALTPAMATLLEGLFRGETLGQALENLAEGLSEAEAAEAERSVMLWFREWVAGGLFARVDLDEAPAPEA